MAGTAIAQQISPTAARHSARERSTQSVPAVEKVFAILEVLANSQHGLTLRELAEGCGVPKSTVHCIVVTLERSGYLHRSPRTSRLLFGRKMLQFANTAIGGLDLKERAEPLMRALARRTGLPVQLGILDIDSAVVVARVDGQPPRPALGSWVGRRLELHCTAVGKVLMSAWSDAELVHFARNRTLVPHNDNTISNLRKLSEELDRVRRLGYAMDDEENALGLRCVGAAVYAPGGSVAAAISVSGSTADITPESAQWVAAAVRHEAQGLSRLLAG